MLAVLWLIPLFPLAGFVILAVLGRRFSRTAVAVIGVGSVGVSALFALIATASFLATPPVGNSYTQVLWTWMEVAEFRPRIALYLDALSLIMTGVITCVGFLIHLYSAEFMANDPGYSRFLAYMNLFVASMVVLVLADNLLLLFLGWEGVGLCSYLLIGFWYHDPANGLAARKAFIVTRVGDTAMAIGLLHLFSGLGTLQIQELMKRAMTEWPTGSSHAMIAAGLLLGGAVGKSAQLPLQTWLPDAMAGPTPTSALIHAATMVTAGVYLIARTQVLYTLAPPVQMAVAVVGAATLILAGLSALTQWDLKKVLAYSTVSQVGYMFLALGVGAWSAAIFHFLTHAFLKALLFLLAGIIITSLHEEHNVFKMGGLRKHMPLTFWSFLIGGCSLAGLPLVTAGFYSKGLIIWEVGASQDGGYGLWAIAVFGVLLTSLYTFRVIFLVFFGETKTSVKAVPGNAMTMPVLVLSLLSVVGGFINLPALLGGSSPFSTFTGSVFPSVTERDGLSLHEVESELIVTVAFVIGLVAAYVFFVKKTSLIRAFTESAVGKSVHQFWYSGWGFDWLYGRAFVRPFVRIAHASKSDVIDTFYTGIASANALLYRILSSTENGRVRWYAAGLAAGSVFFLAMVLFL